MACTVRNKNVSCGAKVIQHGETYTPGCQPHIHPASVNAATTAQIYKDVKQRAKDNVFEPASAIVEGVYAANNIDTVPCPSLPKPANFQRCANRLRERMRPDEPTSLQFDIDERHVAENFFQADISVGSRRHLMFATDNMLSKLREAKRWYIDGTSHVVKPPFYQLLSVHAFLRQDENIKQVPLAFFLMSGKRKVDYAAVLKTLLLHLERPHVQELVVDFEAAIWAAARDVMPRITIRGCAFHWTQAVWRKVQSIGLQGSYTNDVATHKIIRKILALPFLHAEHISVMFQSLDAKADSPKLRDLMSYVNDTWIANPVWSPRDWSVYMQSIRTNNNDCEGWHNRLNRRAKRGSVSGSEKSWCQAIRRFWLQTWCWSQNARAASGERPPKAVATLLDWRGSGACPRHFFFRVCFRWFLVISEGSFQALKQFIFH